MENFSPEFLKKATHARDQLIEQYMHDPDVTMIDVGYDPEKEKTAENAALRIHVRKRWMDASSDKRTAFPKEVDGIRVIVVPGEFRLD